MRWGCSISPLAAPGCDVGTLLRVAGGVGDKPPPGRADHLLQGAAAGRPTQQLPRAPIRRDEGRWVTRTTRPHLVRDRVSDRGLRRADHVENGEADPGAKVADRESAASLPRVRPRRVRPRSVRPSALSSRQLECGNVRVGQVLDVDVIADARPVRRRIVRPSVPNTESARRPSAAASTFGIKCVSGLCCSPLRTDAPATLN
jgi:hypothetical protein